MRKNWAGNPLDNDILYCGTYTGGKIKVYRNLDKATASSIMRNIRKKEKQAPWAPVIKGNWQGLQAVGKNDRGGI